MSQANKSHNHGPLVVDHLRVPVAPEISYQDAEIHAEPQGYQMQISAKVSHLLLEAKISMRLWNDWKLLLGTIASISEREKEPIKRANIATLN